ncbi:Major Facilitator Superfamily protein [Paramicrobacterium humi]|uniref:Major Facilitator Superfamily protein n=1 Tax=Paramicrobacterium humi TaxID=640635 RepID=A0A1H4TDU4_9MICO|nr:MFS transporter [Microbacterium humi]SEC54448.1 Major Facilitator Superfamily protein [Microbacterium humi]
MTADSPAFSLRSVAAAVYLPTLLFGIGEGALIPLIPAAASNLGASIAIAGAIAAMLTVGELFGDIPSGVFVSRIGERNAMIAAVAVSLAAVAVIMLAPNAFALGVGVFVLGLATAVFALARHAFMTTYVPKRYRARSLSLLGGVFRCGHFIGPLLSAPIIHLTGGMAGVYWTMVLFCLATAVVLLVLPDPERVFGAAHAEVPSGGEHESEGEQLTRRESTGLFATLAANARVLGTVGVGASIIAALRSARTVLIPLWAVSLGVDEASTALLIGLAGALDFALFYVSGHVMDRYGRLWGALPALTGLGAGFVLLSATHDVADAVLWLIIATGLLAVANGMSSGILMTLGADLADPGDPAPFLGAWRFVTDAGAAASPLVIAGLTALVSLAAAAGALGFLAVAGVAIMAHWVPRFVPGTGR